MAAFNNEVREYVPIQELDTLLPTDLKSDDLLLVSKLNAYSTDDADSIAVSKKLRYGGLSSSLYTDLSVDRIQEKLSNIGFS